MANLEAEMRALVDRQKIYEVLTRYCRGVDRHDAELIRSVYHEDAVDDHGMFKGRGVDFAPWIVAWMRENVKSSQHFIGNFSCDILGDVAHVETYCASVSEAKTGQTATVWNRYIDRFEKREGEWKIADRLVVLDVTRIDEPSASFGSAPGWDFTFGAPDKSDPVYARRLQ